MRRRRRWVRQAASLLPQVAGELLRLKVVAKSSLTIASDIRRALRFAREMKNSCKDQVPLLIVLMYERAWRDPALSRCFLTHFTKNMAAGRRPLSAAWASIKKTRKRAPADAPNHRFWSGPSALAAAQGPWAWDPWQVECIARDLLCNREGIDADDYVSKLSALPYFSRYFAWTFLRLCEVLGCIRLHNVARVAGSMSGRVAVLAQICPLTKWHKHLRPRAQRGGQPFRIGDVSMIVCETSKALQSLGFVLPKDASDNHDTLVEDLGAGCGRQLLDFLRSCEPLTLEEIQAEVGVRTTESALVDKYFPKTTAGWDREPHICRGCESLCPVLRHTLRGRGYLIASSESRV